MCSIEVRFISYSFQFQDGNKDDTISNSNNEETPPKPPEVKQPPQHHVTMLNKLGQKYHCSVPLLEDEPNSASDASSLGEAGSQSPEDKRDSKVNI